MNNRRKILYIINQDWYFCLHWMERSKAAQNAGFQVGVAVPKGEKTSEMAKQGFEIISTRISRKSMNIFREGLAFLDLFLKVRKFSPDIIHNITVKPNLYGSIIGGVLKVPILSSVTGLGRFRYIFTDSRAKTIAMRKLFVPLFKFACRPQKYKLLFENNDDRELLLSFGITQKHKTSLISGAGVNTNVFAYYPEPQTNIIKILLAARMLKNKGIFELVESSKLLKQRKINFEISIAGILDKGNRDAISVDQLEKWHNEGWINWLGKKNNMPDLIKNFHIITLPTSYGEGIPRFLIEAASCGRPIIATDVPGCRDIVKNGENGFLVPPRDSIALANDLEVLIKDPELRKKMGERGREIVVAEFSDKIVIKKTIQLYEKLLSRKGDRC